MTDTVQIPDWHQPGIDLMMRAAFDANRHKLGPTDVVIAGLYLLASGIRQYEDDERDEVTEGACEQLRVFVDCLDFSRLSVN